MDDPTFARLFYLIRTLNITLPRSIITLIPGGPWMQNLKSLADPRYPAASDQATRLFQLGASLGPASSSELVNLIVSILDLEGRLTGAQWLEVSKALASISQVTLALPESIQSLASLTGDERIDRRPTGFVPFDAVSGGGLVPGIHLFIGAPGAGKSSLMMILAECLAITLPPTSPILYVQTEMPEGVFKARISPVIRRGHFRAMDTLVCAPWDTGRIIDYLTDHPNPETVLIFDSPDPVLLAGEANNVRFEIARAWLDFIKMKQGMVKSILVTSWSRRGTGPNLSMESGAEGAAKERYSDVVIGINPEQPRGVRLECYKNRYGETSIRHSFVPNWHELTIA